MRSDFKSDTDFVDILRTIVVGCRLVGGLLSSMSDEELNDLERTELYRRSPVLNHARHSLTKIAPTEKSVVMELHKIPKQHIGK